MIRYKFKCDWLYLGWNPDHQWFYFPDMTMEEALTFKTFDSAKDGRARYTIHTSFDDPNSLEDAPPRESIETRSLVFLSNIR